MNEFQPSDAPVEKPVSVLTQAAVSNVHYLNAEQRVQLREIAKSVQDRAIVLWRDRDMSLEDALIEALAQHAASLMTDRARLRLLREAVRSACFHLGGHDIAAAFEELDKGMKGSQE